MWRDSFRILGTDTIKWLLKRPKHISVSWTRQLKHTVTLMDRFSSMSRSHSCHSDWRVVVANRRPWLSSCIQTCIYMQLNFDTVVHPCIAAFLFLRYLPHRLDTFEYDSVHPLLLTMLITEIPICRDTTVRFSILKPVCRRLDLPCLKTCQWCKSHWSKSWSHALLLPPLSLLLCSIPGSLTDRCHFSLSIL